MLRPLELRVYPNPWGLHPNHLEDGSVDPTTDAEGRPAGAAFFERHFAGTSISKRTEVLDKEPRKRGDERSRRQRTILAYCGIDADDPGLASKLAAKPPVSLPVDDEYTRAIKKGLLIAADEPTARTARVRFEDPKTLLPKMEDAFGKSRDRIWGPGADKAFKERAQHFRGSKSEAKAEPKTEKPRQQRQLEDKGNS